MTWKLGDPPRDVSPDAATLTNLCNRFLIDSKAKRDAGEIIPRSFNDYYKTCELIPEFLAFVEDIRQNGIINPVGVSRDGYIFDGHRRYPAARSTRLHTDALRRGELEVFFAVVVCTDCCLASYEPVNWSYFA